MVRVAAKMKPLESQIDFKGSYEVIDCTSHNPDEVMRAWHASHKKQ